MDDHNIGNIILYLVLAIIGIIGSVNKSKKATSAGPKQRRPGSFFDIPSPEKTSAPVYREEPKPQPAKPVEKTNPVFTFTAEEEGNYKETYSEQFGDEGERYDPLADLYKDEGTKVDKLAGQFSSEGSMDDKLASSFAGEGVSALSSSQIKTEERNFIAETEINDTFFDNAGSNETGGECFNLRKAVIYSAILERKEYAF